MKLDESVYIQHILDAITRIQEYLQDNELPRGKPRAIKISLLSFLSQQAAGN